MRKLSISTGVSRHDTGWKKKEIDWTDFKRSLKKPIRTSETAKEYSRMSKDQRDAIKDKGGFVGGLVSGGRRLKTSVGSRSMLTIDLDNPPPLDEFADIIDLAYDFEYFIYTTHSHSAKSPRLRLLIPLSRDVMADEYEAVIRKVTDNIGMDYADNTTFQVERLMYWPSASKDGLYETRGGGSGWLDPDDLLNEYFDWTDFSEWPLHPNELKKRNSEISEQQDPTEKPGTVGAFCKVHGIESAIATYLSDEYENAGEDRYTYVHGSTSKGVKVYEDKWSYSHHATDPAGEILCNSFDLVRLHKFGNLDKNTDATGTALPSYKAMCELAVKDKGVKVVLGKEALSRAREDFKDLKIKDDFDEDTDDEDNEWITELEVDANGKYYNTIENILIVLKNDPRLAGKFGLDTFKHRNFVRGQLPWKPKYKEDRPWEDVDDASLRHYLELCFKLTATSKIMDAVAMVMLDNATHPVKRYLKSLKWDGVPRIDTLLVDYFDADDTDYTRAVMRKTMVGAVKRVFMPGCRFETVLTLIGPQGAGKSTFIEKLAVKWHSDNFGNIQNKTAAEQLQGVWIMEIGELAGLKKAEVEEIKLFVSRKFDEFRPAYGRNTQIFKRQNIFIGTTNKKLPLRDSTGGRRFWPVDVGPGDAVFEIDDSDIEQFWAEAVTVYKGGETVFLNKELTQAAKQVQRDHTEQDDRTELIVEYLDTLVPEKWSKMSTYERRAWLQNEDPIAVKGSVLRDKITVREIWTECLGQSIKDLSPYHTRPVHDIMETLENWERGKQARSFGAKTTAYHRLKGQKVR